jgi:IMP dehydrogenase
MKLYTDEVALTFDDVLIVPAYSDIVSRSKVDTSTKVTKKKKLSIPLISANMDTVTETEMAGAMRKAGGLGIIHRFMSPIQAARQCQWSSAYGKDYTTASLGVRDSDTKARLHMVVEAGARIICIDVAHGHHKSVIDLIKKIKDSSLTAELGIEVIAGNVATSEGAQALEEAGADAIKVGIGPGSMCTTRLVTGCGYPQLSAISDIRGAVNVPIIADGGIRHSGDIVKALAAGADTVMIGRLFAATNEAPGEVLPGGQKLYRGMASRSATESRGDKIVQHIEGEERKVWAQGPVQDIIDRLMEGVRSGMSYCGASTLEELRENARFIRVTQAVQVENTPHG